MNLISKKDLLAITGISYGQLYRWKRERLIPDEWFIKQSAYTGQETFFPREQILSRVKSILELKDMYSLEELAKILSPEKSSAKISIDDLDEMEEVDNKVLVHLPNVYSKDNYEFNDVVFLIALSRAVKTLNITEEQTGQLLENSILAATNQKTTNLNCIFFLAGKEYHIAFTQNTGSIVFDDTIEIAYQISLSEIADMVKMKYKHQFVR